MQKTLAHTALLLQLIVELSFCLFLTLSEVDLYSLHKNISTDDSEYTRCRRNSATTHTLDVAEILRQLSVWMLAEFLRLPVYEWSQSFCDILCMSGAEFLWYPGHEWLQSFCDIQSRYGRRISATSSVRVFAELLRHSVYVLSQNFWNTQCMTDSPQIRRINSASFHVLLQTHSFLRTS